MTNFGTASGAGASPPHFDRLQRLDRVLLVAVVTCALLIGFQLGVTLVHPPWIGPVTDWLRAALAWPQLLVLVLVSLWFTRHRDPEAAMTWMLSVAFLSYAVARTLWTVANQLIFQQGVPFPTLPDLFFLLQYPFLMLAFLLTPSLPSWPRRLQVFLDTVLVVGAAAALTWSFVLAPLYSMSGISSLARSVNLAYLVGDLVLLTGITRLFFRRTLVAGNHLVVAILGLALVCLLSADALVAFSLLPPPHVYHTGNWPDLFWFTYYLLVPLALLVALRLRQRAAPVSRGLPEQPLTGRQLPTQDFLASLRFMVPFLAALLASLLIELKALLHVPSAGWRSELDSVVMGTGLLFLVIARQTIAYMEHERMRREQAASQATVLALGEVNRRMETFLSTASHELKTPLTSLQGNVELLMRRLSIARRPGAAANDPVGLLDMALGILARSDQSLQRIARLVNDILDDARVHEGQMTVHLEPGDLAAVVEATVDEQRLLASERTIELELPAACPVRVLMDPDRIAQVVTNYLTNALKYSSAERPVGVRLQVEDGHARVSVHDEGVGVPPAAQAHIWDRFSRVEGVRVQSGSGIGLGIGLHVSQAIIEAHHGQVGVTSDEGQGSTFWFTLPLYT